MTRADIEFEAVFGYWYNLLNEKFYSRCDLFLNLVQLVGGSAAAAGVMAGSSALIATSGVALAVTAACSLAWQPGLKAERHAVTKRAFIDLRGNFPSFSDEVLAKAVAERQKGEAGLPSLNMPAVHMTRRYLGADADFESLTSWQRTLMRLSS